MKISLCLMTFNEIEGCKHDVPRLKREYFDQIYAVDAGSRDGTIKYLIEQNIPVYLQPRPGLNAAYNFAFEKCSADALVFFHPKGTIPTDDTLRFKQYFEQGYELIVGSRVITGAINEEDYKLFKPRKWFVMGLGLLSGFLWRGEGNFIWDVLHGFKGITRNAYKKIAPRDFGLSIDIEMVSRAYKKQIKRIEFPTSEKKRLSGSTHFKALPTGAKLLKYVACEIVRVD